jgi:hypothetical protein
MRGLDRIYPARGLVERELGWLQEEQLALLARDAAEDVPEGCEFQLTVAKDHRGRCEATLYARTDFPRMGVDAVLLVQNDGTPEWAAKGVSVG